MRIRCRNAPAAIPFDCLKKNRVTLEGESPHRSLFYKGVDLHGKLFVRDNPLRSRSDVERAAVQLIEPLLPLLSPNKARLHLGDTGAVYPDDIAQMEAFARPLWAIVPMLARSL